MSKTHTFATHPTAGNAQQLVPALVGTGTVDLVAGSATVIGVGTFFNTKHLVGDRIIVAGEERRIQRILSDTKLVVSIVFPSTLATQAFTYYVHSAETISNKIVLLQNDKDATSDLYFGFSRAGDGSDITKTTFTWRIVAGDEIPLTGADLDDLYTLSDSNAQVYRLLFTNT